jgi:hypothetical protein
MFRRQTAAERARAKTTPCLERNSRNVNEIATPHVFYGQNTGWRTPVPKKAAAYESGYFPPSPQRE